MSFGAGRLQVTCVAGSLTTDMTDITDAVIAGCKDRVDVVRLQAMMTVPQCSAFLEVATVRVPGILGVPGVLVGVEMVVVW